MGKLTARSLIEVGAGGDVRVLHLLETQSDGTELLGPDWSLIRVLEHAQDEDQHRKNAANVDADGQISLLQGNMRAQSIIFDKSIGNALKRKEGTNNLHPSPALANIHRVHHLQHELRPILQNEESSLTGFSLVLKSF